MELNRLPKTNAYNYKNEDTIKRLCKRFGVNPASIPKKPNQTWDEKYPHYVRFITGYDPCPICNGPQGLVNETLKRTIHIWDLLDPAMYCLDHPSHTSAITFAVRSIRKAASKGRIPFPGNWHWIETLKDLPNEPGYRTLVRMKLAGYLGDICQHNDYLLDCPICIQKLKDAHEERQGFTMAMELAKGTT